MSLEEYDASEKMDRLKNLTVKERRDLREKRKAVRIERAAINDRIVSLNDRTCRKCTIKGVRNKDQMLCDCLAAQEIRALGEKLKELSSGVEIVGVVAENKIKTTKVPKDLYENLIKENGKQSSRIRALVTENERMKEELAATVPVPKVETNDKVEMLEKELTFHVDELKRIGLQNERLKASAELVPMLMRQHLSFMEQWDDILIGGTEDDETD